MLRNDALYSVFASLFQKLRAVALDVIAVTQHPLVAQWLHQFGQDKFAVSQWSTNETVPLNVDQIEDVEKQSAAKVLIDRLLESLKTRTAGRIECHNFTVEYRALQLQS